MQQRLQRALYGFAFGDMLWQRGYSHWANGGIDVHVGGQLAGATATATTTIATTTTTAETVAAIAGAVFGALTDAVLAEYGAITVSSPYLRGQLAVHLNANALHRL